MPRFRRAVLSALPIVALSAMSMGCTDLTEYLVPVDNKSCDENFVCAGLEAGDAVFAAINP